MRDNFMERILRAISNSNSTIISEPNSGPFYTNRNPADVFGHKSKSFKKNKRKGK